MKLHAPDLLLVEAANVLWKRALLGHDISVAEVHAIYRDLITIPLQFYSSEQLTGAALDLALQYRHSVYDLIYGALAVDLDCELITADTTFASKLAKQLPLVRHLADLKV